VVVVIGVGDVLAMNAVNLDLEPVADIPGIVDGIKIVDTSESDTCRCGGGKSQNGPNHQQ